MRKLNLGCGKDIRKEDNGEWINVDISKEVDADVVMDMRSRDFTEWKKIEGKFDEIVVNNSLTQVAESDDFVYIMNRLWSLTEEGGVIKIRVPYALHECAWQDPMDCRRFTPESFTYMQQGHRRYEQYGKHYGFLPFEVQLIENNGIQMHFELRPWKN